ncbi:uncharacterized protein LOC131323248 isoform X1 [Rhododendron vialii]|uniref:uncharacterized protein LOC131323248 isoform X1 n=1 Tax=Rhododendron vialii TaxID=182163 RepID=UPI00265EDC7B|nr:uncharacterized protein LOC131323248 isoform X1 [Rhododendron vialii]
MSHMYFGVSCSDMTTLLIDCLLIVWMSRILNLWLPPYFLASDKALHYKQTKYMKKLWQWFGGEIAYVWEALDSCKISEREVCVQRIPTGFCGFGYLRRTFSLADIASGNEDTLLGLLRHRVNKPGRVQISVVKPGTRRSANLPPGRKYWLVL